MKILTGAQMRDADKYTIEEKGVASLTLMENAGLALANECEKLAPTGDILCVCGGGNNGGDGYVCARILMERKRTVSTISLTRKYSEDCKVCREKWLDMDGDIIYSFPEKEYALIVDCMFGTGFHGALEGEAKSAAEWINKARNKGTKVLSADIPSGVNGDNGKVDGVAVQADRTLCLGEIKTGVLLGDGIDYAGEIVRVDIGISLPKKKYAELLDREGARAILPLRKRNSNKGSYGRAAIVAGSAEYTGAAYLAASACLRSGAGYTTLFVAKDLLSLYALKAPELLLKSTNKGSRYAFKSDSMEELLHYDSIAFGMGMGISEEVFKGAAYLLSRYEGKLILDADALNSLAAFAEDLPALLANKKCDVVLTPHGKEFSRLSGISLSEIAEKGMEHAKKFAKRTGVTLLLKNAVSIVTDGNSLALNATGNSSQAKGGSGDALAGVIAGLCAQGVSAFDGAKLAAYLMGKSAELATAEFGEYSLTATELISYLPKAFLQTERAEG